MSRRWLAAAVTAVAVIWPVEARVSQVFEEPVPFTEVAQAPVIVIATSATPPTRTHELKGKKGPAFAWTSHRYVVVEEIRDGLDKDLVGQTIEVHPASVDVLWSGHQLYHEDGISESPILSTYTARFPPGEDGRLVLFLYESEWRGKPQWRFTVDGAVEGEGVLPELRKLLTP